MSLYYRKIQKYKYQLVEQFSHRVKLSIGISTNFIKVNFPEPDGIIRIEIGYTWDGSTMSSDKHAMKASLVHDALYQLMRLGQLDISYREYADQLYRDLCIEAGMSKFQANIRYWCLQKFAKRGAMPKKVKEEIFKIED